MPIYLIIIIIAKASGWGMRGLNWAQNPGTSRSPLALGCHKNTKKIMKRFPASAFMTLPC